ncbi:MAG TPA: pitrilysin family protein [Vicinamibacterales bacterium]|nr:pitrilysin family protein [Vicinamibacterales bacterium]
MIGHNTFAIVALSALIGVEAVAQPAVTHPLPPVRPERPFTPAPRVERTLSNGLHVIVLRHATVPKATVILGIESGLAVDPAEKAGLAQFVVDLAQEGTATRTSEQIKREVFALGASLSGFAGQDVTSFQMRGLSTTLPQMFAILADVARSPSFPQSELDLIKARTAQQLQAQTASPQYVNNKLFRQTLFGGHPYARIGVTPETLPAIDRQSIANYHETYYRPNNAVLIVVGDVNADAVFAAAEKAFGTWERRALPEIKPVPLPDLKGRTLVFVQRPNSVQSSISVGNFSIERDDPRWYTLQLTNQIFGAAFDSRLIRNIREEKGYTYSPQSIFQSMGQGGLYRAVADVRNDVTGATLKEIYHEIDKLRSAAPEAEELSDAKQYSRGLFVLQNATQTGLANTLSTMTTYDLPKDYLETFQRQISQPSAEAIRTGAQMLLGSENSVIVIVGDYTKVKDQLGAFTNIKFFDLSGKPIPEPK